MPHAAYHARITRAGLTGVCTWPGDRVGVGAFVNVWISMLGPLYVAIDGIPVQIPPGLLRSLFAALAVEPGRLLLAASLADLLWDFAPPETSNDVLRNHVKRLRKLLGPAARHRVVSAAGGYRLDAGSDEVDVLVFQSGYAKAKEAADAGEWTLAAAEISRALALWRDSPFADISSRAIHDAYVKPLHDLRFSALEIQAIADMRTSEFGAGAATARLRRLVTENPGHERLRVLLMLGLALDDRRQEALQVFEEARAYAKDQYGLDPGRLLSRTQRRILDNDDDLLGGWSVIPG